MKSRFILLILGLGFVVAPIYARIYQRRSYEAEVRDVAGLRGLLDSTRAALAHAGDRSDSARLTEEVRSREHFLSQREYHLPFRQASLDRWWRPTRPAAIMLTIGVLLLMVGLASLFRRRHADTGRL